MLHVASMGDWPPRGLRRSSIFLPQPQLLPFFIHSRSVLPLARPTARWTFPAFFSNKPFACKLRCRNPAGFLFHFALRLTGSALSAIFNGFFHDSLLAAQPSTKLKRRESIKQATELSVFPINREQRLCVLQMKMWPEVGWRHSHSHKKIRPDSPVACADLVKTHLIHDVLQRIHLVSHQRHTPFPVVESDPVINCEMRPEYFRPTRA